MVFFVVLAGDYVSLQRTHQFKGTRRPVGVELQPSFADDSLGNGECKWSPS
jgi:hypothetical protein